MRLTLIALAVVTSLAPTAASSPATECSSASYFAGGCVASIGNDSITIASSISIGGGGASAGIPAPIATTPTGPVVDLRCGRPTVEECLADPAPAATGADPITITDLASFTPAVGELIVQPENWGVLGIPTNFIATATDHVQDGTLLGTPVQVRWRPVAFTFDYGDGTVVTTTDGGTAWASTADDWTTTSTSHEYQHRGEYTASVTVTFEADVGTASGWSTVPGTLDLAAPSEPVQIYEVHTVLTRGDCIDYPSDPGCAP